MNYEGLPLSQLGASRLEPELRALRDRFAAYSPDHKLIGDRKTRYTPAYEALIRYIRRVNVEDDVNLQVAGEYHADTSELVQMLAKGHHGVALDREAWDRLITWIDLNGPCHGTWRDVAPIPHDADRRRWELAQRSGGPAANPEDERFLPRANVGPPIAPPGPPDKSLEPIQDPRSAPVSDPASARGLTASPARVSDPAETADRRSPLSLVDRLSDRSLPSWSLSSEEAARRQRADGIWEKSVDLGEGTTLQLVRIPPGTFVMGSDDGEADESPAAPVTVDRPFWMSRCEITNEQYRRFDPAHDSGVFTKRSLSADGPGIPLDQDRQPVVRVSWQRAVEYCAWLSAETGLRFRLPTEAQWEYTCRAGSSTELSYGGIDADFSSRANVADAAINRLYDVTGGVVVLQEFACDERFDDRGIATTAVASYEPNAWGLYDLHGNASEWTQSAYRPYPYQHDDGRNGDSPSGRKVVRGGSFFDRP